ncbi:Sec-independent protein translocase protein TatB [Corynebacterium guangdongense]|uniref:Sec-independent protein translocase protein TatB n=1 Tax=Corynebacterium guangdongense TaxID=1783348 RepID=A0ABU1ZVV1_9CORY|nr:Sec-independent protein translocase protein TatB [Corynebacterium guangdongense]MDR7329041.1 sec-independent protein translocase protein TatB [Corynebacterium guangdongense]WJZ17611.1 sec-independent translocase [Corynebacterium guangdongense]
MFSNIGWGEIFAIAVIAVIVIGPERLPGVIKDVRAAIYAARKAIRNARVELDGTLDEFEELKAPIAQAAEWGRMGPRAAISKALFDGDEEFMDEFDPRRQMKDAGLDTSVSPKEAMRRSLKRQDEAEAAQAPRPSQPAPPKSPPPQNPTHQAPPPGQGEGNGNYETGGGFSWADIT